MSEVKRDRPHFELARIYQDGSQEIEQIELYNLENVLQKGSNLKMVRRGFLGLSALSTTALLAACQGGQPSTSQNSPPTAPTATPSPSPTPPPVPPFRGQAPDQGLDVYSGPDLAAYSLLFTLPGGTQFTMFARNATADWVEIRTDDQDGNRQGWSQLSLIVTNADSSSVSSLPVPNDIPPPPEPTVAPTVEPTTVPGGSCDPNQDPNCQCTCNQICICIPVGG